MQLHQKILTGVLLILTGVMVGMLFMIYYAGITSTERTELRITEIQRGAGTPFGTDEFQVAPAGLPSFRGIAATVNESVVYIETEVPVNRRQVPDDGNHDFDDSTWDRFFPRRRASTIGSGVLVSADGYIITNNHVIAGTDEGPIRVTLHDKRVFNAKVIGRDPSTDLATIKIDSHNLPHAVIGNSDYVEVGDWVLAVGNPFRLRSTVTAGIVSALGRNVDIIADQMRIESFIQTDAAINRGNSGGALVNQFGELIGINTAIATENGGNQGYGFAIPINMAFKITQDLIEYGEVRRGFLGVNIVSVSQERANQLGMPRIEGVEIVNILRNSSAETGGLRNNDVILSVDGFNVNEANHLQERVALRRPGDEVTLEIWRNGRVMQFDVPLSGLN
ncbi:MAG: trypsin-like peptidase domain-containing protein [Bacteroidetes bacterium]|nr:trypsin-like peptidase domain-containing protein [Bacteroidota bacterium]MCH8523441.1 trypsin-like peptidase domain-containing protein [Balneolales bacterium]